VVVGEAGASRQMVDGSWVVSRTWAMAYTGASAATVHRWAGQRERYPNTAGSRRWRAS
jgi:hypothetical protein